MKKRLILEVFTGLLLILFVYTGINKIIHPEVMEMDLKKAEQPEILRIFATSLSYVIPLLELTVSFLLFIPKYRKFGYFGALFLMAAFTFYVGYILFFFHGSQRPCTCGGIFRDLTWKTHFIVNLTFTAMSIYGVIFFSKKQVINDHIDSLQYNISQ